MSLTEQVAIPRKTMVLFFLVDTSGSMMGDKIGTVNSAVEQALVEIKDLSESNADSQIKIAVLNFSTNAEWSSGTINGPIEAENFLWNDLDAGGVTDLGAAFKKLNENLSKNGFMKEASGSFAPAIFLMSDGEPTDDYKKALTDLQKNNWFKKAIKVALAIGSDANTSVLEEFTGNSETVLEAKNKELLTKMIKFVSVRSSEVGSKSTKVGNEENGEMESKQDEFVEELKEFKVENASENWDDDDDEW